MGRYKLPIISSLVLVSLLALAAYTYSQYSTPANLEKVQSKSTQEVKSASSQDYNLIVKKSGKDITIANESDISFDKDSIRFEFTGYSVARKQTGTFDNIEVRLNSDQGKITSGEVTIRADSVNTGISLLDEHLKSSDFFDTQNFPEIKFTFSQANYSEDKIIITGDLAFHGITQKISFPVVIEKNTLLADFIIDTSSYNFSDQGVNSEVRISFSASFN